MARSKEFNPFRELAIAAARAVYDKKAEDVVLWDVRESSIVADFLLLASATSPAHLDAIDTAVSDLLEESGLVVHHRDGRQSAAWRVLDYGGILVHLMSSEARTFYALDKLNRDTPKQRWMPVHRKAA